MCNIMFICIIVTDCNCAVPFPFFSEFIISPVIECNALVKLYVLFVSQYSGAVTKHHCSSIINFL